MLKGSFVERQLNYLLILFVAINSYGITVTPVKVIDPAGADNISYNNPGTFTISSLGATVGARSVTASAMNACSANPNMGVLDFEPVNGWNQATYLIRDNQNGDGKGSAFDTNAAYALSPYLTSQKIGTVNVSGMTGSQNEPLTVTFKTVLRDNINTVLDSSTTGGVYREYDTGGCAAGYMVTSGNYGVSTPGVWWNGSANVVVGTLVTFSSPVKALGLVANVGHPSSGIGHRAVWYDANGNELARGFTGVAKGNATFWGLETDVPAIKSMWIGDNSSYSANYTIDDVAFISKLPPRYEKDLSGTWKLSPYVVTTSENDPAHQVGFTNSYYQTGYDDSSWQEAPVPLLWPRVDQWRAGTLPAFANPNPDDPFQLLYSTRVNSWRYRDNVVSAWYRTSFTLPVGAGPCCRIRFGGLGTYCQVYLNGINLGTHWGQLSPFAIDATGAANFGGKNVLVIFTRYGEVREGVMDYGDSNSVIAGIWRPVIVETLPALNMSAVLVDPLVSQNKSHIRLPVANNTGSTQTMSIIADVVPAGGVGDTFTSVTNNVSIPTGTSEVSIDVPMAGAQRWFPESPFMYQVTVRLESASHVTMDEVKTRFGYREFKAVGNKFYLNGIPIRLFGIALDGNHWGGEGLTAEQRALQTDEIVTSFMSAGHNSLRLHNPTTVEFMDAADNHGLLLYQGWQSSYTGTSIEPYITYMKNNRIDFMREFYNHPSIVMWNFGNECWNTNYVSKYNAIYTEARAFDTSGRPIIPDSGSHSFSWIPASSVSCDAIDIHHYIGDSFSGLGADQRLPYSFMDYWVEYEYGWLDDYYGSNFEKPVFYGESTVGSGWAGPSGSTLEPDPYVRPDGTVYADKYVHMANPDDWTLTWVGFSQRARYVGLLPYLGKQAAEPLNGKEYLIKRMTELLRSEEGRFAGVFPNDTRPWKASRYKNLNTITTVNYGNLIFAPVSVALIQPSLNVFAGENTTSFNFYVVNDSSQLLSAATLEFCYDSSTTTAATVSIPALVPGDIYKGSQVLAIPSGMVSGRHILRLFLKQENALIAENLDYLNVYPRPAVIPTSKTIKVWTPNDIAAKSSTLANLTSLGLTYIPVSTRDMTSLNPIQDVLIIPSMLELSGNWSVVAPDYTTAGYRIRTFLNNGGTVLCMEQSVSGAIPWATKWSLVDKGPSDVMDPAMTGHPLYAGLDRRSWMWFNGNRSRLTQMLITPLTVNVVGATNSFWDDLTYMTIADAQVGAAGHLIHSQVYVNDRFSTDSVAACYVRNLINYALGNSTYAYVQSTDLAPEAPILSVVPCCCNVDWQERQTTVDVSNVGVGTMAWTAQVIEGESWLSIISETGGTGNGTISVHIDRNTSTTEYRTAKIRITALNVEGSPVDVTFVQNVNTLTPGDANGDGAVDVGDLGILAANYGASGKKWAQGDFNGDGLVDVGDLGILAANYGANSSSADWDTDYAKMFDQVTIEEEDFSENSNSSICGSLGLPVIAGLVLMGLSIVKLEVQDACYLK
jgi:hypothetical protein